MSKVISFSISDRYLDKLRTLYPSLTDNLAAKQFITDGLESSLGNSLDDSLDGILDDKVKTLIEAWVDGLLDERLDDAVKKSITSLSERLSRLESRLDDTLDGRLDDMEPLLKREKECSIASIDGTVETVTEKDDAVYEPDSTIKTGPGAIDLTNKEKAAILGIHDSNLSKWLRKGIIPDKYLNKCRFNHDKTKIILI